jgi:hypothetical protein
VPYREVPMREKKLAEHYRISRRGEMWCVDYADNITGERVLLHPTLSKEEAWHWLTDRSPSAEVEICDQLGKACGL